MSDAQYYFVHLPKCAGTSVLKSLGRLGKRRLVIVSQYPQSKRAALEGLNQQLRQRRLTIDDPDMIFGHDVFYGIHQGSGRDIRYVTIMRDPVLRWVSQYRYIVDCSDNPKSPIHRYARAAVTQDGVTMTMDQCAQSGAWTNMMTHYLAAATVSDLDSARWGPWPDSDLHQMARSLVDRMSFIGFVDQIYQAEATISQWFGMRPKLKVVNASKTKVASEISASTREKITSINRLDQAIYDYAKTRMGRA